MWASPNVPGTRHASGPLETRSRLAEGLTGLMAVEGPPGRGRGPGGSWGAEDAFPVLYAAGHPLHAASGASEPAAVTAHKAVWSPCHWPPARREGGGRKSPGNSRGRDLLGPGRSASAPRVFKNSED